MATFIWAWDTDAEEWIKVQVTAAGYLKVHLMPEEVTTKRMTGVGQVVSGAAKLHWLSMNPSAADSEAVLTDDLDGSGATVFDMFHASRDHMHMLLSPPMPFTTGIYLKTLNHMTSVMFGYTT